MFIWVDKSNLIKIPFINFGDIEVYILDDAYLQYSGINTVWDFTGPLYIRFTYEYSDVYLFTV